MKDYYVMYNVGTIKYLVNYHNGIDLHDDKSKFYHIQAFTSKVKMNKFIKQLEKNKYKVRGYDYV